MDDAPVMQGTNQYIEIAWFKVIYLIIFSVQVGQYPHASFLQILMEYAPVKFLLLFLCKSVRIRQAGKA